MTPRAAGRHGAEAEAARDCGVLVAAWARALLNATAKPLPKRSCLRGIVHPLILGVHPRRSRCDEPRAETTRPMPGAGIEPARGCPQRILRRFMPHQNRWLQGRTQPGSTVMPRRIVGPVVQRAVQDSLGEDAYRGRHAAAQKIAPTIMKV